MKEESEKVGLKLNIKKLRSWHPVPSFMTNGRGKSGSIDRFYFGRGGFKITADSHCSHEVKRHLLLGRKTMTNLDNVLKSRDITFPTKVHIVKDMVFPKVMYRCESQTIKKAKP